MGLQQAHHALAHVGIEGVVRTAHHNVVLLQFPARLEVRRPHADAQGTRFGTARHDAAVVVGQHHHGVADQSRVQALFAGGIEIVSIDQGRGLRHGDVASERMDDVDGDAPDLHLAAAVKLQRRIVRMGGFQAQPAAMTHQAFEGEGTVKHGHNHLARARVEAAIDHQKIAIVDAGVGHRFAAHMQEKGAGGMPDQLFIEVDPHIDIVISRGRETSGDAFPSQGQGEPTALGLQGQRSVLELHGSSNSWLNSTHVLIAVGRIR